MQGARPAAAPHAAAGSGGLPRPPRCGAHSRAATRSHPRPPAQLARAPSSSPLVRQRCQGGDPHVRCMPPAAAATESATDTEHGAGGAVAPSEAPPAAMPPEQATPVEVLPVALCRTWTLPAQESVQEAAAALAGALEAARAPLGAADSGVARFEVPLPRQISALRWLQGQHPAMADAPAVYFSGRSSTAPDTPHTAAAEAGARAFTAVAGVGAAWLWHVPSGEGAAAGAHTDAALRGMSRFLSATQPRIRLLGGARFNPRQAPAEEWAAFGAHCFLLPQLELAEVAGCSLLAVNVAWDGRYPEGAAAGGAADAAAGRGHADAAAALAAALSALAAARPPPPPGAYGFALTPADGGGATHTPAHGAWGAAVRGLLGRLTRDPSLRFPTSGLAALDTDMARQEFVASGQQGLDDLLAAITGEAPVNGGAPVNAAVNDGAGGLTKVVLARASEVLVAGRLEPLQLLAALQERDPRAYQLFLSLPGGRRGGGGGGDDAGTQAGGQQLPSSFLGSTPERLYVRSGRAVASEAVAGTRPRGAPGDVQADFYLGLDLLKSNKDHAEFMVTRDAILDALARVCHSVTVEVPKSVLKQAAVQHLYGRLAGTAALGVGDADLLRALHPTPAVCGRPRGGALRLLEQEEPFDRGFYSGPFGWVAGDAAEFVVAIRSALVLPQQAPSPTAAAAAAAATPHLGVSRVLMYAGVGVVPGSDAELEWAELQLKVRALDALLTPRAALAAAPNANAAWAALAVEELVRLGVSTFCVAPGSRSSPLALAAARHPRARLHVGLDERALAYWAVGHARGARTAAAVITSSGTAVANLLPAAVEAAQAHVPLVLLTADRPPELRDAGANQAIDQVKIFGGYVRWAHDLPPPCDAVPGHARTLLSAIDTAVRHAHASPPGPVHLNLQFREPLAPLPAPWNAPTLLRGLDRWQASTQPLCTPLSGGGGGAAAPSAAPAATQAGGWGGELSDLLGVLAAAKRGLVVVGETPGAGDALAAARLGAALGWPVAADVLSGLRVGAAAAAAGGAEGRRAQPVVLHHLDLLLTGDEAWWEALRPDCIVQIGPHLTSKRVAQFLEWAALDGTGGAAASGAAAAWVFVGAHSERHDPGHLVTHRVTMPVTSFARAAEAHRAGADTAAGEGRWPLREGVTSAAEACASGRDVEGGAPPPRRRRRDGAAAAPAAAASAADASRAVDAAAAGAGGEYARLLRLLDGVAAAALDSELQAVEQLCEPFVARTLAATLPPGHGLFLGNSMPIRDMDSFAGPAAPHGGAGASPAGQPPSTSSAGPADADPAAGDGVLVGSLPAAGSLGGLGTAPWPPSPDAAPQGATLAAPLGAPVAANRGASGIDGVLSTAAGFADGLARPATLLVGDLSFLHDVGGLALLRGGEMRRPLTVVLINNGGGGIFSFLPVAGAVEAEAFEQLWATPQNVDLEGVCRAYGMPFQRITGRQQLQGALRNAWALNRHSVVEVVTDRSSNVDIHRRLQAVALAAAQHAFALHTGAALLRGVGGVGWAAASAAGGRGAAVTAGVVRGASLARVALPLSRPLTPAVGAGAARRETLLLCLSLEAPGGKVHAGVGEAAPLPGLHAESLAQAEAQLRVLGALLQGVAVPPTLPLLGGQVEAWLRGSVGVDPGQLLPSVRCALDTAVLQALAAAAGVSLAALLAGPAAAAAVAGAAVGVNGLVSGWGSCEEAAAEALRLVREEGYSSLKIKVGRRASPAEDAAAVVAVRAAVGPHVSLFADANRAWSAGDAIAFGRAAAAAGLDYVEEPTSDPSDMAAFFLETGVPVAVDESLDEGRIGPLAPRAGTAAAAAQPPLALDPDSGLSAAVVKPSVVGGLEAAWRVVRWARQRGVRAVVSSAFESSVGVAALAELAAAADARAAAGPRRHGLGTLGWFVEDALQPRLPLGRLPAAAAGGGAAVPSALGVGVSVAAAAAAAADAAAGLASSAAAGGGSRGRLTRRCEPLAAPPLEERWLDADTPSGRYRLRALTARCSAAAAPGVDASPLSLPPPVVVLLHGFMGCAEDWVPVMAGLQPAAECLAVDLPGHGGSSWEGAASAACDPLALGAVADAVVAALQGHLPGRRLLLVGYSLGARLALQIAAAHPRTCAGVAVVSGTPGLVDAAARAARERQDAAAAALLRGAGLPGFLDHWYSQPLWDSLRRHPRYSRIVARRVAGAAAAAAAVAAPCNANGTGGRAAEVAEERLARVLESMGTGRMAPLWGALPALRTPLLLVSGQLDPKFCGIHRRMLSALTAATATPRRGGPAACGGDGPEPGAEDDARAAAPRHTAVEVAGAGHAVHEEAPLQLAAHLHEFLQSLVEM